MMRHTVEKVPQVQGKSCELMLELMEAIEFLSDAWGCEKSWTARYFPGLPGLGTRERGEDWKGPMRASSSVCEKGPIYLPFLNSFSTISL